MTRTSRSAFPLQALPHTRNSITGIILAGGRARRMGYLLPLLTTVGQGPAGNWG
mgnify:CR=1 FL=1